ncbi:MAG: thioredoxin family protein [Candidatus Bathyarchaeota archaeon]|jgi:hypothetical protein|nr:thioredoxin family protein [Candidatus Bathyarchaeota archaeon]
MTVNVIEFAALQEQLVATSGTLLGYLAPDVGKVYVVAVTRDACSACEKQKPKLSELSKDTGQKHQDSVVFTRIHVGYSENSKEESRRSKDILGHYFYPTNMVLIRTPDRGPIELYRNVASSMDELGKNIEKALEIAAKFGKRGV